MRVVIDGRYLCDAYPGIGRYLFALLEALPAAIPEAELVVLVNALGANSRHDLGRLAAAGLRLAETRLAPRSLAERVRLGPALDALAPDLVHSPYYFAPRPRQPRVLALHDVLPLKERVPSNPAARLVARAALRRAARSAQALLVPTQAVARDVQRLLHVPEAQVRVAAYGVEPCFRPQARAELERARRGLGLPERYVLHVGSHAPHKNVERLLRAWNAAERHGHVLVLAGGPRSGSDAHVRALGNVDEAALAALYGGATLAVLPSLDEGFGLPLLEAMACGTPVACARAAALDEVAGGAAALFDPRDAGALAHLLGALLGDAGRRAELAARGLERAAGFSWRRTAELTAETYRVVLGAARRGR